jgi:hypothetical protein
MLRQFCVNTKTTLSIPKRQLVKQEYDASGSWRGPGQRNQDWPSCLGRLPRAVRLLQYHTRSAEDERRTHVHDVLQYEAKDMLPEIR